MTFCTPSNKHYASASASSIADSHRSNSFLRNFLPLEVLAARKTFQKKLGSIFGLLKKLGTAIEMYFGEKMNIDQFDYRWTNDRIERYESKCYSI